MGTYASELNRGLINVVKLEQFFGIDLSKREYDLSGFIGSVGLDKEVKDHESTQALEKQFGEGNRVVQISKRQVILKALRPLLGNKCLPYDSLFYRKECNTSSDADRRYGAEEKLLQFALMIASGKSLYQLESEKFKPDIQYLREQSAKPDKLLAKLEGIMSADTRADVLAFKKKKKGAANDEDKDKKDSFWQRLFS